MCPLICCLECTCVLVALCMMILCWDHMTLCTMEAIENLSGWLCWVDGHHMWLLMRYILLRLLVNRYMYVVLGNLGIGYC